MVREDTNALIAVTRGNKFVRRGQTEAEVLHAEVVILRVAFVCDHTKPLLRMAHEKVPGSVVIGATVAEGHCVPHYGRADVDNGSALRVYAHGAKETEEVAIEARRTWKRSGRMRVEHQL